MQRQVRFPLSVKLVTVIAMLLLFSLGGLTVLVSVMTRADVRVTAEQYNIEMNKRSAIEALALLNRVHSAAAAFVAVLDVYGGGRDALAGIHPGGTPSRVGAGRYGGGACGRSW